jgi:NAD(P)H-quinone oxidoreductase subunit 3
MINLEIQYRLNSKKCYWIFIQGRVAMFQSQKYGYFWIFLLILTFSIILILSISRLITPENKGPEKLTTYMFALVFVVFDVETVFLYPWAMSFYEFGILSFIEALIFISILIIGLIYAWRKGALEWS